MLVLAAILFIADIAIRRFRINLLEYLPIAKVKAWAQVRAEKKAEEAIKSGKTSKKATPAEDMITADKTEKGSAKNKKRSSEKTDKKEKKAAKKEPTQERLDTSQLLNRMKK